MVKTVASLILQLQKHSLHREKASSMSYLWGQKCILKATQTIAITKNATTAYSTFGFLLHSPGTLTSAPRCKCFSNKNIDRITRTYFICFCHFAADLKRQLVDPSSQLNKTSRNQDAIELKKLRVRVLQARLGVSMGASKLDILFMLHKSDLIHLQVVFVLMSSSIGKLQ